MAFLRDTALDAALADLNNVTAMHICSQEPTNYTEATSTYSLGSKSSPTIGAAADNGGDGRKRTVAAITDGTVSANGTWSHWALVSGSELIVTGALNSPVAVVSGAVWQTSTGIDIIVKDAIAA